MIMRFTGLGFIALSFAISACASHAGSPDKEVWGWVEKAQIEPPWNVEIKAKLDTGALTSSLHAEQIERFEKDGEKWVRFIVEVINEHSDELVSRQFEKPLFRNVIIRGAGGEERRPVVLMSMCMGDTIYEEQFTLEDRDDMLYPLLIGRRTIQHLGVIDVTKTFAQQPDCPENAKVLKEEDLGTDEDIGA